MINTLLFMTVFRLPDAVLSGQVLKADYWMLPPPMLFLWIELFSFVFTAAGLLLLLLLSRSVIAVAFSRTAAKAAFVFGGFLVGFAGFGLLLSEWLTMGIFGVVSGLTYVLFCPHWFDPWDDATLAEE